MKATSILATILLLASCTPTLKMRPHRITDDSNCGYTFHPTRPDRPKTIFVIYQTCQNNTWMDYFFDIDSSVWKANGFAKRRKFEYRLVYDSSFTLKLTNAEKELFKNAVKYADSIKINHFNRLDKATGFIKQKPLREY